MYIYGLIDPRGPELFYVGCTAKPSARLRKHRCNASKLAGKKLRERIRAIKQSDGLPQMVILERTDDRLREYAWIQFFAHLGLVNTVRQAGTTRTAKRTPEELSAICRATWFRRNGGPPTSGYVKKTHTELSAIYKAVWAKRMDKK